MIIDALMFPPTQCNGEQGSPLCCECLRSLAGSMLADITNGVGKMTPSEAVHSFPIEGIIMPSFSVRCERDDIGSLRELQPILVKYLEEILGAERFEINYGVVPFGRVTRTVAGPGRLNSDQLSMGPSKPAGIEKITGWFPCIPQEGETGLYPKEVTEKGRRNKMGVGTHFILLEPEPNTSGN